MPARAGNGLCEANLWEGGSVFGSMRNLKVFAVALLAVLVCRLVRGGPAAVAGRRWGRWTGQDLHDAQAGRHPLLQRF